MAGVVIDISTGEVIERFGSEKNGRNFSKKKKPAMEILAPDGRKVFLLSRVSRKKDKSNKEENVAA